MYIYIIFNTKQSKFNIVIKYYYYFYHEIPTIKLK